MIEKLILEGNKFVGKFHAQFQKVPYRFGGDTYDRHHYFWEGQCLITGNSVEVARALFRTPQEGSHNFVRNLEEAIISFGSRTISWPPRPEIKDYKAIIDMVLGKMHEQYQQLLQRKDIFVPELISKQLDINELTRKEFIIPRLKRSSLYS